VHRDVERCSLHSRCVYWRVKSSDVVIAAAYLHEDDVSEMTSGLSAENSVAVTSSSHVLAPDNCLHHQPTADRRHSNHIATSRHTLRRAEPDELRGSANTLSVRNERTTTSETMTGSKSTVSDKQNNANDSDVTEIKNEPILELEIDTACDGSPADDKVLVTGKRRLRFKRFKGIGPTDEATGIPIASRTVSKTYVYL